MAEALTEDIQKRALPWRWIGIGTIVAALFLAWRILPMEAWLSAFNAWVAGLGVVGMLVYGLFYIAATVMLLPGSIATIGSGFLFGLGWGTVVVSVSATTGAGLAFLIARYLARERVAERVGAHPRFGAIDRAVGTQGGRIVGLLRLSPALPFSLSNYLFGLTAVRFWPYLFATWLGTLPGTVMYVYLGVLGKAGLGAATETGAHSTTSAQYALLIVGLIATVAVTVVLTRIARHALTEASAGNQHSPGK